MEKAFKSKAEKTSINYRKLLGLKAVDPLLADDLAECLKIKIINPMHLHGITSEVLNPLVMKKGKSEWSAVTIKSKSSYIIIFNPSHSDFRYESDIMHELAHVICDHNPCKLEDNTPYPFPLIQYDLTQEEEAEWLGACLKLPREALVWAIRKGMDVIQCGEYFKVSNSLLNYRKNVTGIERQLKFYKK